LTIVDPPSDPWITRLARFHRDGDEGALRSLVQEIMPWLRTVARRQMRDVHRRFDTSEDVVQDTLARLLASGPWLPARDDSELRGLLFTIVRNLLTDRMRYIRAQRRDPAYAMTLEDAERSEASLLVPSAESPLSIAGQSDDIDQVRTAILLLSPSDAHVLSLRVWHGRSFADIALEVDSTADAVRMRFNRAVTQLGQLLRAMQSGQLALHAPDPGSA